MSILSVLHEEFVVVEVRVSQTDEDFVVVGLG